MKYGILISLLIPLFVISCSVFRFARHYSAVYSESGRLVGNTFESDDTIYEIGILCDEWKKVDIRGGDITFLRGDIDATITVNSSCEKNIVKYNLIALSESLIIGFKDKKLLYREYKKINELRALYSVYTGNLDGHRLKLGIIVLKDQKCAYDLSYTSSPSDFELGIKDFSGFYSAFKVIKSK